MEKELDKVIGLEAVKNLARVFGKNGVWQGKNNFCDCPYRGFIEEVTGILSIKPEELAKFEYFCGCWRKDIMVGDPGGRHNEVGGVEKIPFSFCEGLLHIVSLAMGFMSVEDPGEIRILKDTNIESEEQLEEIKEKLNLKKEFQIGCKILDILKQTTSLEKDKILGHLDELAVQLKKIAGPVNESFFRRRPCNCPAAPAYEHKRWLHID